MTDSGRGSGWRQGDVLSAAAMAGLGLLETESPDGLVAVVVSHDCDLAARWSAEPDAEVVMGRLASGAGRYSHGRDPRRLRLEYQLEGEPQYVELKAASKRRVPKSGLEGYQPLPEWHLGAGDLAILRGWLAARYDRAAWPEEFERRLRLAKPAMHRRMERILEDVGRQVRALLARVDGGELLEHAPGTPYSFELIVLYVGGHGTHAAQVAQEVARELRDLFASEASGIELSCFAMSDEAITVAQAGQFQQWRLEHLSYLDPQQPILQAV